MPRAISCIRALSPARAELDTVVTATRLRHCRKVSFERTERATVDAGRISTDVVNAVARLAIARSSPSRP
jgi:hypothetical protein